MGLGTVFIFTKTFIEQPSYIPNELFGQLIANDPFNNLTINPFKPNNTFCLTVCFAGY